MVTNEELARRYTAGDTVAALAADAGMTEGGVYARLTRLGVPRRRTAERAGTLTAGQIADALTANRSVAAAARALGVGRGAFTAQAQRHGLLAAPAIPEDLASRYADGASVAELAKHYQTGTTTIVRWLDTAGVTRRPRGRRPRDE